MQFVFFFHLSCAFFFLLTEAALKGKNGSQDLLVPSVLPEKDVCTALSQTVWEHPDVLKRRDEGVN